MIKPPFACSAHEVFLHLKFFDERAEDLNINMHSLNVSCGYIMHAADWGDGARVWDYGRDEIHFKNT